MAQNTNKRYQKKRMSEINVVPYIDVMLVLLTIFMITAPLLTEGYRVQLPEARSRPIQKSNQPPIVVSIDAHGRLYVNLGNTPKQPVTAKVLIARVVARRKQYPKLPILIQGVVSADYGKVINAMSLLNDAGVDNFSLVTRPGRGR